MVDFFEIGHISNTHGLKGELKVRPFTDDMKRFEEFESVLVEIKNEYKEYMIESVRYQNDVVLLKFKDVNDIETAERLKNHFIFIPRANAKKLENNEFYIADLIGAEVYENELIGVLDDVFTAGAGDVYVVKRKGKKDLLLPANDSVILSIDVEAKKICVKIPRGLDDEV